MVIEVKNLSKRFGDIQAVDNITFNVKEGEIFGFLGPNGAGKTTTVSAYKRTWRTLAPPQWCG
ncbi:hypothetical protein MTTB_04830 [Methanothermobacter tenebrarum]|jgi:ABC-2 type transport system ATP-binding protein|uniref:ABC transporter domain-containing protein n=1 Tax=Methanothermobacter tenebrarum TaxID=680118 RepID=A0ABM7YCB8_9EURY|nr:hypothetical protein MTTB_04830 [Methanothermobacter tenebrarum]